MTANKARSPKSRDAADVIVVGAGIIGCMIARELRNNGADVILVDRDSPGHRATWAAGGMLSPLIESAADDPFFHLADRSFDLYPALVHAVQRESGIAVDFRTAGKLQCALDDEDTQALRRLAASPRAVRYGLQFIDGDDARRMEPALSENVRAALFVARDHCIDNRLLIQALSASATALGVHFRLGIPVERVIHDDARVTGVQLASGAVIGGRHIVIAAGAWSGELDGLPRRLPVVPIRGQMICVDARGFASAQTSHTTTSDAAHELWIERVVGTEACYMIPRSDGRVLLGATVEDVGFAPGPTPSGLAWLINAATAVLPDVARMPMLETWAGYRPGTPDSWPIIGADPHTEGLVYASGHFRNGILLAPVTAAAVASIIAGNTPEWVEPFGIARFAA